MENQSPAATTPAPMPTPAATGEWTSTKVYTLGAICLVLGIILGALFHGPAQPAVVTPANMATEQPVSGQMPSQMPPQAGGMSQGTAPDPVFEKVKADPNNFDLLVQAGTAAMKAGTPKVAVDYFERALKVKDDTEVHISLGNADFRAGDADKALAEFAGVLKADPKNDKALYNTGVVRLMAKNDPKGAVASWETLLKFHPDHPHKAQVLEMIKRVKSATPQA